VQSHKEADQNVSLPMNRLERGANSYS
jgi:hypothetical protein